MKPIIKASIFLAIIGVIMVAVALISYLNALSTFNHTYSDCETIHSRLHSVDIGSRESVNCFDCLIVGVADQLYFFQANHEIPSYLNLDDEYKIKICTHIESDSRVITDID